MAKMRNAASALLLAATISGQLVGSASADPRFGRFGMRFRSSSHTSTYVEEAALDTPQRSSTQSPQASSLSSSSSPPSLEDEETASSSRRQGKFVGARSNGVDNKPQTTFGGDDVDVSSFFTSTTPHASSGPDGTPTFVDDTHLFPTVVVTTSTPTTWPSPFPGTISSSLTSSKTSVSSSNSQTSSSGSASSGPPWSPPPGPVPSSNTSPTDTHPGCLASSRTPGVTTGSASTSSIISSSTLSSCDSSGSSTVSTSASCTYSNSGGSSGFPSSCSSTSGVWTNSTSPSPTVTTPTISTDTTSWSVTNTTSDSCFTIPSGWATTVISVIHTSTVTWWGDPEDYTDPYEPVEIPTPCPTTSELLSSKSLVLTATTCDPLQSTCAELAPPTQYTSAEVGISQIGSWTYTYYVTERNPAVEYSSSTEVPDYGGGGNDGNGGLGLQTDNNHQTATQTDEDKVPNYGGTPTKDTTPHEAQNSHTDVVVEVRPTEVIINTVTISNNPSNPTTTVVAVGTDTFTIGPSAVVGAGATVTRAGSNANASPTTTTINGISVVVSGSVAVVGGATFTIGTSPTTQTVNGQAVTIGPTGVAVAGVTIPIASSGPGTQVIVAGGEMITAMGKSIVVVEGTTYTYGPGSATITEVVDDDTILIGPSGVVIDGTTLGGSAADGAGTTFTIVGGATITEIGASVLVINGHTYTIGPGTGTTTTVVGGETLTIGTDGVTISGGQTLTYPFGPTLTTTLHPGGTATADQASATATDGDDKEEDAGFSVGRKPDLGLALGATCIAIGVGFFGFLI